MTTPTASSIKDRDELSDWVQAKLGSETKEEMTEEYGVHLSSVFLMLDDDPDLMEKCGGRFPASSLRAAAKKAASHASDPSMIDTEKFRTTMNDTMILRSYRRSNDYYAYDDLNDGARNDLGYTFGTLEFATKWNDIEEKRFRNDHLLASGRFSGTDVLKMIRNGLVGGFATIDLSNNAITTTKYKDDTNMDGARNDDDDDLPSWGTTTDVGDVRWNGTAIEIRNSTAWVLVSTWVSSTLTNEAPELTAGNIDEMLQYVLQHEFQHNFGDMTDEKDAIDATKMKALLLRYQGGLGSSLYEQNQVFKNIDFSAKRSSGTMTLFENVVPIIDGATHTYVTLTSTGGIEWATDILELIPDQSSNLQISRQQRPGKPLVAVTQNAEYTFSTGALLDGGKYLYIVKDNEYIVLSDTLSSRKPSVATSMTTVYVGNAGKKAVLNGEVQGLNSSVFPAGTVIRSETPQVYVRGASSSSAWTPLSTGRYKVVISTSLSDTPSYVSNAFDVNREKTTIVYDQAANEHVAHIIDTNAENKATTLYVEKDAGVTGWSGANSNDALTAGDEDTIATLIDQPARVAREKGVSVYNLKRMQIFSEPEIINAGYTFGELLTRPNVNDDGAESVVLHTYTVQAKARVEDGSATIDLNAYNPNVVPEMRVENDNKALFELDSRVTSVDTRAITLNDTIGLTDTAGGSVVENVDFSFSFGISASAGSTGSTVTVAPSPANTLIQEGMVVNDDPTVAVTGTVNDQGGALPLSKAITVSANELLKLAFPPNFTLMEILNNLTTFKGKGMVDDSGDLHLSVRQALDDLNANLGDLKKKVETDGSVEEYHRFLNLVPTAGFNFANLIAAGLI